MVRASWDLVIIQLTRTAAFLLITLGLFMALGQGVYSQELEPRAYAVAPVGLNFIALGMGYSEGDVLPDPSVPLEDAEAKFESMALAYVRTLDFQGRAAKFQVVLPYVWLSAKGNFLGKDEERDDSGLADPRFRFTVNLYGGPALSLKEFAAYKPETNIGLSFLVTAPWSKYDDERLANIGTNRWSFKPELGISRVWKRWTFELAAGATVYTTNNDFYGEQKVEQDVIYSAQSHAIYIFRPGLWGSLGATYYRGGQTTVDGVKKDNKLDNWRFGFTMAVPLDRQNSLKFYGNTGVFKRTGTDFDAVGMAWQYRW